MRLVVKVGSAVLSKQDGSLNHSSLNHVVTQLSQAIAKGHEVLLVSSGAIAAGNGRLKIKDKSNDLILKQAAAAVGQLSLMEAYEQSFSKFKLTPAQVLITREDLNHHERFLNIRNTLLKLLSLNVIPIINENDCVSTEEIQVGDNDTLSAIVAAKVEADKLIILSNVRGLYELDEEGNLTEDLISEVSKVTRELEKKAVPQKGSVHTVGGMTTKIEAAKMATAAGVETWIASGHKDQVLVDILAGKNGTGTKFTSAKSKIAARHSWIAFGRKSKGSVVIDDGAHKAIVDQRKSLLPSGIRTVKGSFSVGDTIAIKSTASGDVGRGLVNFSSDELKKIKGHHSKDIEKILSRSAAAEVIHRDNLVLM